MPAKKRKTAWYMMGIVTFILAAIVLFLPLGNSEEESLFTKIAMTFVGQETDASDSKTKIILGGDVMLGRSVMATSIDKDDFTYPFLQISSRLKQADAVFVNLENAIVEDCPKVYANTLKFCGLPRMLDGLKISGINVVTLANNHSRNYGESGLEETRKYLDDYGILYTDKNLVIKEIGKRKFGFIGFDFFSNEPTDEDYQLIRDADLEVDYLILGIHWGVEYTREPRNIQREWATKMIDAGADFIAGHHPHWVQINETINDIPVYYSLGNLVFDQMWSEDTKKGLLLELEFNKKAELVSVEEINIYMDKWAQPMIVPQN